MLDWFKGRLAHGDSKQRERYRRGLEQLCVTQLGVAWIDNETDSRAISLSVGETPGQHGGFPIVQLPFSPDTPDPVVPAIYLPAIRAMLHGHAEWSAIVTPNGIGIVRTGDLSYMPRNIFKANLNSGAIVTQGLR